MHSLKLDISQMPPTVKIALEVIGVVTCWVRMGDVWKEASGMGVLLRYVCFSVSNTSIKDLQ